MTTFLYRIAQKLPIRVITINGDPYLERYYLGQLFGLTFYLHHFVSADSERHLHDHPWRAMAIVLSGGYIEERKSYLDADKGIVTQAKMVSPLRPSFLGLNSFHRIALPRLHTWTLFIHGKRRKAWGFAESDQITGQVVYGNHLPENERHQPGWWKQPENQSERKAA